MGEGGTVIQGSKMAKSAGGEISFGGKPRFVKTGKKMDMGAFPMLGDEAAAPSNPHHGEHSEQSNIFETKASAGSGPPPRFKNTAGK
jgi:hypothetical protein